MLQQFADKYEYFAMPRLQTDGGVTALPGAIEADGEWMLRCSSQARLARNPLDLVTLVQRSYSLACSGFTVQSSPASHEYIR